MISTETEVSPLWNKFDFGDQLPWEIYKIIKFSQDTGNLSFITLGIKLPKRQENLLMNPEIACLRKISTFINPESLILMIDSF